MTNTDLPDARVATYAVIVHRERLLLVPGTEFGEEQLPGGPVPASKPVEERLHHLVGEQLGATIKHHRLWCAVESKTPEGHQIALLFDVTLAEPEHLAPQALWRLIREESISRANVHPAAVHEVLVTEAFGSDRTWQPAPSKANPVRQQETLSHEPVCPAAHLGHRFAAGSSRKWW